MSEKALVGSLIVGQSGGPSSVINCSAYGVIKTGLENPNITKVYGAHHGKHDAHPLLCPGFLPL